jgi:hypothetical protein
VRTLPWLSVCKKYIVRPWSLGLQSRLRTIRAS